MGNRTKSRVNGISVAGWEAFRDEVRKDASVADRRPAVTARWVGGSRSRVEFEGKTMHIGGNEDFNAMQALLAALAACDVDLIALHAALLGLEVKDLRVEATGHFNVRAYLGLEAPGSGYTGISYKIILNAPGASDEQIRLLRERIERSSPVGDSLGRSIPLTIEFNAN
ncbi:OsmC family protein [Arthrobacter sp. ISL-72]|uniref:OsmC family protein n=1 Tax=Arthrobacter sp. ISL-72 TaxID=2819114 RepID=UPI001BEAAEA0|nr:OsmC family protein [Arthrobacter sp. ISL-72]MBT2596404.1 OsmC family protein [Arthrobacter sp. ISL-72]